MRVYSSVTLFFPSRSRHALFSVTLFYACAKGWRGRDTRVRRRALVRESTPDQTLGPSLATARKRRQRTRVAASEETAVFVCLQCCYVRGNILYISLLMQCSPLLSSYSLSIELLSCRTPPGMILTLRCVLCYL